MKESKLTLNGILVAVLVFSALAFLVTVKLTGMADRTAINSFNPIEGTDYSIRYSNREPDGLYKGTENTSTLLVEGTFGYDWGAVVCDDCIYINEYSSSDLGYVVSKLVRIDLNTLEKQIVSDNTVLRGKCASGELVALSNYILPANNPGTNRYCNLYNLTVDSYSTDDAATVIYINPENGETVYSITESKGIKQSFEELYLERTLEEVKG